MRDLTQFSTAQWLRLLPLQQGLRQVRNDLLQSLYLRTRPPRLDRFLADHQGLRGRDVALVIAFEQPWALNWLLEMARKHLRGVTVLVFDNSRTAKAHAEIAQVCAAHATPYLALPAYRTRHVNRSHGMAMSWVFHNVVRTLGPRIFGFIDHDLIPVSEIDFSERLQDQPVFGLINAGNFSHWSTWAGYCLFRYAAVADRPLNFLYDFSRGLDTGGRNWNALYRNLDASRLRFARQEFIRMKAPWAERPQSVECIDERWIHIGGVGYNENFNNKFDFFHGLKNALEAGGSWEPLRARHATAELGQPD